MESGAYRNQKEASFASVNAALDGLLAYDSAQTHEAGMECLAVAQVFATLAVVSATLHLAETGEDFVTDVFR